MLLPLYVISCAIYIFFFSNQSPLLHLLLCVFIYLFIFLIKVHGLTKNSETYLFIEILLNNKEKHKEY